MLRGVGKQARDGIGNQLALAGIALSEVVQPHHKINDASSNDYIGNNLVLCHALTIAPLLLRVAIIS
ncbi:hypothetical protein BST65_32040 [Bradyrhizobium canariense]|nr:hypothetical protein BST65_32040 [Bradyrhizobium canariense]OSI28958.1 hypothetical protein BST66_27900 [Bradyrhizobium canariense]OSI40044.1 hypothetical protein BSZ20_27355 [Bradyrhizobium canariense]OSI45052.1 hypothetical protein BST67_30295 [Bradyrhizobium canariense]OSI50382.1 hypothetical protein BSZ15_32705 [Bradyrhizobium canariense]